MKGDYIIFTYFRGCLDNRMSDISSIEINQSTAKKNSDANKPRKLEITQPIYG